MNKLLYLQSLRFCHFLLLFVLFGKFSERAYSNNGYSYSSQTWRTQILEIIPEQYSYKLNDKQPIVFSETVQADSVYLQRNVDYIIDYKQGIITFISLEKLPSVLLLEYCLVPDFLTEKLYYYIIRKDSDSTAYQPKPVKRQFFLPDDGKLVVSGSKTFSVTFSNQETYSLKQSLYLNVKGELSPNVNIEAQLSDSESPLSPEGESRELSSLDQIYLKVYGRQYEIAFGDLEWEFTNTRLMRYKTRFEGMNLWYKDNQALQAALAVNGGKQTTNTFYGVDGKQGPYYLSANTISQNIQVVPGSEEVSINGENLERGNDYIIDYSEGTITFKVLVTSNSRILVNFQFTDEYYRQNLYLNSSTTALSSTLKLHNHFIWQRDDRHNPLQWAFTSADKDSLRQAGDSTVWGEGAVETEPGKGLYLRKVTDEGIIYYEYAVPCRTTLSISVMSVSAMVVMSRLLLPYTGMSVKGWAVGCPIKSL